MAGQRDQKITAVIPGLTKSEARKIKKDIIASKNKYAPKARGGILLGEQSSIGRLLTRGSKLIGK